MEIAPQRRAGPKRIGELLVAANAIKPDVLLEALQVAKKSSTPLGRVLMSIGELTERDLQAAIEVQSLIRQGVISPDFGVKAINLSVKSCVSVEEAFHKLGWTPPDKSTMTSTELGELLEAAGIVSRKVLEDSLKQSQDNNLPLGRCLVLQRAISQNLLASALTAQVLLRDGKITREQALMGLKAASRKHQSIEASLQEFGVYKGEVGVRVGDLLSSAGIVTEGDKISAVEVGLTSEQPVGQVLLQTGMISQVQLDDSLKLQNLVNAGQLSAIHAAEVLRQAQSRGLPIENVLAERNARRAEADQANQVIGLLAKAQIVSQMDIQKAYDVSVQLNISVGEVLLDKGVIDKAIVQAAAQSQELVNDGILQIEQVCQVLSYCHKSKIEFHDALKEITWDTTRQTADDPGAKSGDKLSWLNQLWSKVKKKE